MCTCTDMEDAVMGLRVAQCSQKPCEDSCRQGFSYVLHEGECCGRCLPTACELRSGSPRGDTGSTVSLWKSVGSHWASLEDPCLINECVRVKDEVFVQQRNVSCPQLEVSACPVGFQLHCRTSECCPSCHCEPVEACLINGTVIGPGKSVLLDECTSCRCTAQGSTAPGFKLECRKTTCQACPPRDEMLQDGCDSHLCKVNKLGEYIWEKRVTGCPPLDEHRCLAEGVSGRSLDLAVVGTVSICDSRSEAPDCRDITARLQHVKVGDCTSQEKVDIHYCEVRLPASPGPRRKCGHHTDDVRG
ncbi:von Willebrand factor [Fukomys damarensis]|uniref:von Willebrand factor n=1 Tax=Fukomys damarensis TaxID=885580 RepID=A0A091ERW3_FUKDA|nr:von Willebrand factor [Fukomys damarensis]